MPSREHQPRPRSRTNRPGQETPPIQLPTSRPAGSQKVLDESDTVLGNISDVLGTNAINAGEQASKAHQVYDNQATAPKIPQRGQIATAEANPGDSQATDADEGEDRSINQANQNQSLYKPSKQPRKKQKRPWITLRDFRIIGILTGLVIGGLMSVFSVLKGPLELLQLGSLFDRFSGPTNSLSKARIRNLSRYSRAIDAGDIGETRVGFIGSKFFHLQEGRLADIGITFDRTNPTTGEILRTGSYRAIEIEAAKHPELKDLGSLEEVKAAISEKWGIPLEEVHQINGLNGGKFRLQLGGENIKTLRILKNMAIEDLGDGKILTFLTKRVFSDFLNLPTLFHPIQKFRASRANRLEEGRILDAYEEKDRLARETAVEEGLPSKYTEALDSVREAVEAHNKAINIALFASLIACELRDLAHKIPLANFKAVVAPAMQEAISIQAVAHQERSGEDMSLGRLDAKSSSLRDKNGTGPWGSKAINALSYNGPGQGLDIPDSYKQAFAIITTSVNLINALGDNGVTDIVCSTPGKIIQAIAGIALIALGPGGWVAKIAQAGATALALSAFIDFAKHHALDALTSDPVKSFAGAAGGGLLAYGARASAGSNAARMGGVALEGTNNQISLQNVEQEERQEFQQKSLFARMLDPTDYRSLTARAVQSSDTNPSKAVSSLATSLLQGGNLVSKLFSVLSPPAFAAEDSYDWGTPIYSIPQKILDDPAYEDPYENANVVGQMLNSAEGKATLGANTTNTTGHVLQAQNGGAPLTGDQIRAYADRAMACFGVVFFRDEDGFWNVAVDHIINPTNDDYQDAHCDDLSDPNWVRFMLFVTDSSLVTATECYTGNEKACQLMVYGRKGIETEEGAPLGPDNCPINGTRENPVSLPRSEMTTVRGIVVHPCMADNLEHLLAAAEADGIHMSGGGWRSNEDQIRLRREHGCADPSLPASACTPPTAPPGTSRHETGTAVDFTCGNDGGDTLDLHDPCWEWMNAHATTYGFHPLSSEAWHWSIDGH